MPSRVYETDINQTLSGAATQVIGEERLKYLAQDFEGKYADGGKGRTQVTLSALQLGNPFVELFNLSINNDEWIFEGLGATLPEQECPNITMEEEMWQEALGSRAY